MDSTSQEQKGPDVVLSTLDADIQVINRAKDAYGIQLAQDAFDSSSTLLTTIKVRPLLFRHDEPRAHICAGRYGR